MFMMNRVVRLLEASHTVRLLCGSSEDGSRNGKRLSPAVVMTPAVARPLARKAASARRARMSGTTAAAPR